MSVILPTLYLKNKKGALMQWSIAAHNENGLGRVRTIFGQVDSPNLQETSNLISQGKNLGKANATTPYTQAVAEANQLWEKQIKKGYVESKGDALAGITNLPGFGPTLAWSYKDHKHKLKFSLGLIVQPKFDGFRCMAEVLNGKCTLYSRSRKVISSLPHIVEWLEKDAKQRGIEAIRYDGELYNHDYSQNFNSLASRINRKEVHPQHTEIQYHVYDLPPLEGKRSPTSLERIQGIFRGGTFRDYFNERPGNGYVREVPSILIFTEDELNARYEELLDMGYEGMMIRTPDSRYEHSRTDQLLKMKEIEDAEFKVIGVIEGTGKLMGHAGAFLCEDSLGKTFRVKMKGPNETLKDYLVNFNKYEGRMLTVEFHRYTPDGLPRHPRGKRFREAE